MKEEIQRKWEKMRGNGNTAIDNRMPKMEVKKEELISCVKMIQSILQQYGPWIQQSQEKKPKNETEKT